MNELLRRLRYLFHRERFERDLDEEMRHHLALKAEERGSSADAARAFGNVARLKEESRAMWGWTLLEQLAQDVRYSLRAMAANPLFTAMAVLSLALGIGANTAIFSFMDAIMLRALPVRNPSELVTINWRIRDRAAVIHGQRGSRYRDDRGRMTSRNYPFAAFPVLEEKRDVLAGLSAYALEFEINLVAEGHAEVDNSESVSGSFFDTLGVVPAAGRLIADADDRTGAPPVAVIGYNYWTQRFASNTAAIGSTILVNNVPFTVIGVAPPGFFGVDPQVDPKVYLPLHAAPLLASNRAADEHRRFFDEHFYWVEMIGRLRPGVTAAQADAVLAGEFHRFVESTATTQAERTTLPTLFVDDGAGGASTLRRRYSKPLFVLMTMVVLILAIACANIANLQLARAAARRREMAVRLSLGAGRLRVIRQLLTESTMLAFAGAALGMLIAFWGIQSITWLLSDGSETFNLRASLDWRVLAFTVLLSLGTALIFGLAPAFRATRVDLTPALKGTRSGAALDPRRGPLGIGASRLLVATQVAISLLLVVAAGMFGRTLSNLESVNLGFNKEHLLLFKLDASQAGYHNAELVRFYAGLLDGFRHIPGVRSAALSQFILANGSWNSQAVIIPGYTPPPGPRPETCYISADPAFLDTMQIPIVAGRGLEPRDLMRPNVAVITEQFAKKFFSGENPIGRFIGIGQNHVADLEIVGLAKNTHYNNVKETETPPVVYMPYTQNLAGLNRVHFELRTAADPMALANDVRRAVQLANPNVPVSEISTQAAQIAQTFTEQRTFAYLCGCFAALALAIACVGLYGSMSYAVARRTSEIGIRMALGAERSSIIWMVLREVLVLGAAGLAAGLLVAWFTSRFVESFLFGIKHHDPATLAAAVFVLLTVALIAGYAPAWRASRIEPVIALRHE